MRKRDLVKTVAANTGITRDVVETVIDESVKTVKNTVINGEKVFIRGFGAFCLKQQAPKMARDITRGIQFAIPARNKPHFKPYREFIEKANNGTNEQ